MKIKNIEWLSQEAREAVLDIGDHEFHFKAFSCPFSGELGDEAPLFYSLLARHAYLVPGHPAPHIAPTESGYFGTRIVGEVVSTSPPVVRVVDVLIELDTFLPGDIESGQWVECVCNRLDLAW